jgi:hypothetical protein
VWQGSGRRRYLSDNSEGKKPPGRTMSKWEENVSMVWKKYGGTLCTRFLSEGRLYSSVSKEDKSQVL